MGYGAGNVPGTALLDRLPGPGHHPGRRPPPVVVVRNSRREPIFAPLVLGALEAVDPDLVSTIAVLIWDYEDAAVQEQLPAPQLLAQADLVIAAASDETIAQIDKPYKGWPPSGSAARPGPVRFHAHGHKVSFSAIGREMLAPGLRSSKPEGPPLLDVVALLAALDSVFWDQHGCLSSRIHFVETGGKSSSGSSQPRWTMPAPG